MGSLISLVIFVSVITLFIYTLFRNTRDRSTEEAIYRAQAERAKIKEALKTQKEVTKTKEKAYEDAIAEFDSIVANTNKPTSER